MLIVELTNYSPLVTVNNKLELRKNDCLEHVRRDKGLVINDSGVDSNFKIQMIGVKTVCDYQPQQVNFLNWVQDFVDLAWIDRWRLI